MFVHFIRAHTHRLLLNFFWWSSHERRKKLDFDKVTLRMFTHHSLIDIKMIFKWPQEVKLHYAAHTSFYYITFLSMRLWIKVKNSWIRTKKQRFPFKNHNHSHSIVLNYKKILIIKNIHTQQRHHLSPKQLYKHFLPIQ